MYVSVKNRLIGNCSIARRNCVFVQGCDRTSPSRHALGHYQTAHSVPHDIAVNLTTFAVWYVSVLFNYMFYCLYDHVHIVQTVRYEHCPWLLAVVDVELATWLVSLIKHRYRII
jgi:Zn-finger in ubiquitin-hydrolases and other protein